MSNCNNKKSPANTEEHAVHAWRPSANKI